MNESFCEIIEKLSVKYSVQPLIPDAAAFIFILESPHVQELKHGAPVAGSSGKTMAAKLLGDSYNRPLGLLIKENMERGHVDARLNKIGVMNVSNIPLQRKAYDNEAVVQRYDSFFSLLEKLRTTNHKVSYASNEMNELQQVLVSFFTEQLKKLTNRTCTIIPCGRFAQKFLNLSPVRGEKWTIIHNVPHPSYNSWNREQYRPIVTELLERFNR